LLGSGNTGRGTFSPLPRRFDTSRHGQPGQARAGHSTGDSLGAVPEMRPSWGLLTAFSRLCVAGVLRFVCASWWCLCGFRAALGRGSSWVHLGFLACSSPVRPPPGRSFSPISDHSGFGLSVATPGAGQGPIVAGVPALPDPATGGGSRCSLSVRLLNDLCSTVVRGGVSTLRSRFNGCFSGFARASS
jgi:hypothetical protein